ncbi:MAG: serine/threonine protein kinase [Lachnospiraceae bacterium]|nr:serine/threonine protein kinase [Lachnospiraceae bacterium]
MSSLEQGRERNKTLQAGALRNRATIPVVQGVNISKPETEESALTYQPGDRIGNFTLTKFLCRGVCSSLFLGEDRRGDRVTVKLYEPGAAKTGLALRKLSDVVRKRGCTSLMPLYAYGDLEGGIHYEVMPVYQQGTLEKERFTEEEVIQKLLPQLNEALKVLGESHLVHNDIKPSNIFWKDRSKWEIVLGDYDCVTFDKEESAGGTLLYMAPERIFSGGKLHSSASDYCSLGLTLITLLLGREVFVEEGMQDTADEAGLRQYLYRRWQRQVSCPLSVKLDPKTRDLLDRMVQQKPEDRYGSEFIASWIENGGLGVRTYREKVKKKTIKGLRYKGKLILDIPELISVLGNEWEFGTFMLAQHQLDDFVRQFDGNFYKYSQEFSTGHDMSAGLFKLMQTISPSADFYWLGSHYDNLEDFVDKTEETESYGIRDPFCHFCRAGLLSFYEKNNGANQEQMKRAYEIEETGRKQPELAVRQLQISLRQKPDFIWHGATFKNLEDMLDYFDHNRDTLDEDIAELYESKAAKVWLDYIGQGSLLSEIARELAE